MNQYFPTKEKVVHLSSVVSLHFLPLFLNEFLYLEVLVNLHSCILALQKLHQVLSEQWKHLVRLVTRVLIDWNTIRKLKEKTLDIIVHDYQVLQGSPLLQDLQVFDVDFIFH